VSGIAETRNLGCVSGFHESDSFLSGGFIATLSPTR
jgi:hypothetical protein